MTAFYVYWVYKLQLFSTLEHSIHIAFDVYLSFR